MKNYTKLTTEELLIEKKKLQQLQRQQRTYGIVYRTTPYFNMQNIIDREYKIEFTKIDRELQKRTK